MLTYAHPVGAVIAVVIIVSLALTVHWMLHPPSTKADRAARVVEADVEHLIGSILIVFSPEIHSEPLMALAARLARRAKAQLLTAYIIEVPHTLPLDAEMESEQRQALDALATAESIARKQNIEVQDEIIKTRQLSQGVLQLAKQREAHLILIGAYREGKYSGAPLGRAIEMIAARATCDVLIGVPGTEGTSFLNIPAGEGNGTSATRGSTKD
ncbi:MAG TPA: universal stress protein [Candidatus Baltobacteraceae bacterium]|nr:universal stress protein [Candidatus Baltobacteraceae bacterium]